MRVENSSGVQIYDTDLSSGNAASSHSRGNNSGLRAGSAAATKESRSRQNRKGLCVKDPHVPWQRPDEGNNMEKGSQPFIASAPGKRAQRPGPIFLIQLQNLARQGSWCVCVLGVTMCS